MNAVWQWITGGIAHLISALKLASAGIAARVLASFGLTMITFETVLPALKAELQSRASGLPAEALNFLGAIGLGEAMSMVLSALTIRLAHKVFIVPKAFADSMGGGA